MQKQYFRHDITRDKILDLKKQGLTGKEVAERLDCSDNTIREELRGTRGNPTPKVRKRQKTCHSCGCRPVAKNNFWLCDFCHRHGATSIHDEHRRAI